MFLSWRAAICAAPTVLVLAGSAWLAQRSNTELESAREADPTGGVTVVWPSAEDNERLHRVAVKQETVVDLLDGRLSFDAAAERFWELTSSSPEALAQLRDKKLGDSDEERVRNQLLVFARVQAARDRGRYAAALARVEDEARTSVAPRGIIH
jgi:hypothetical protein